MRRKIQSLSLNSLINNLTQAFTQIGVNLPSKTHILSKGDLVLHDFYINTPVPKQSCHETILINPLSSEKVSQLGYKKHLTVTIKYIIKKKKRKELT